MQSKDNAKITIINAMIKEKLERVIDKRKNSEDTTHLMDEIWDLSKERFILLTKLQNNYKRYEGVIFTVGYSPEPIILNILGQEPKSVFFIYTQGSEEYLNRIIKETNLKPTQFKRDIMIKDSPNYSYGLIKVGIGFLHQEKKISLNKIAMDPTGGTKIMTLGCGIAASIFNIDIIYVGNEKYNAILRRPELGSEVLRIIPNPLKICKNDLEIDKFQNLLQTEMSKKIKSLKNGEKESNKNDDKDKASDLYT